MFVKQDGGDLDIHLQRVGGANAINLTADSSADDTEPAFSPDGSQIAFRSERDGGGLFVMGATGESVRRLTDEGYDPVVVPRRPRGRLQHRAAAERSGPTARSGSGSSLGRDRRDGREAAPLARGTGRRAAELVAARAAHRVLGLAARRAARPLDGRALRRRGERRRPHGRLRPRLEPRLVAGRPLLDFASDRGGTLSVWRLEVDEASGRASGSPQPLPVPFPTAGYLSFTRDGRRLLLAGAFGTDTIQRLAFDPARAEAVGDPKLVFASSLRIFYVAASADGSRVAFTSGGRREELFTLSADGSGLRQLTDDAFKDRGPIFLPDGKRLLLYSTRSGRYEAWSMNLDGSGATQLTRTQEDEIVNPVLSPDGSRFAMMRGTGRGGGDGAALARLDPTQPTKIEPLAPARAEASSSTSRGRATGRASPASFRRPSGQGKLATYTLASGTYRVFDVDAVQPRRLGQRRPHAAVPALGLALRPRRRDGPRARGRDPGPPRQGHRRADPTVRAL